MWMVVGNGVSDLWDLGLPAMVRSAADKAAEWKGLTRAVEHHLTLEELSFSVDVC